MALNKNALIRYKTIDECLQNRFKQWTLYDLVQACSEALYEYEGKMDLVSKRTVQLDLQNMRSSKLYEAPIEVYQRKYYRYADPEFSIKRVNVSENDLLALNNAIQILKQFKDFSAFQQINSVIHKLEDSISLHHKTIIHLDKNEQLKGISYIDELYHAVLEKKVLKIIYKSFHSEQFRYYLAHPQLLKEYNNRWFLLALIGDHLNILALDRIEEIHLAKNKEYIDLQLDADAYFKEVIGVTVSSQQRPMKVKIWVDAKNLPYVLTKPLHHSQICLKEDENGGIIQILVQLNKELERLILGFGKSMKVLSPKILKNKIKNNLIASVENYSNN